MAKKDAKTKAIAKAAAASMAATSNASSTTAETKTEVTSEPSSSSPGKSVSIFTEFSNAITTSYNSYLSDIANTPRLRLLDTFLAFLVALGVLQFVFAILVGNFPFNAFLGGFASTVGQFVLTVSLRLQSMDTEGKIFGNITPERALGDYIFASVLLHFVVFHFIN